MMHLVIRHDNGGSSRLELWKLAKPPTGAVVISVNFNTSDVEASGGSVSFIGTDGTIGTPVTGTGNAAPSYTLTVPSASGNIVFNAGIQDMGTDACTARTISANGQTTLWAGDDICTDAQDRHFAGYQPGAATVDAQWTSSTTASVGRVAVDVHAGTYTPPSAPTWPYIVSDMFASFNGCTDGAAPDASCMDASTSSITGRTIGTWDTSRAAGKFTIRTGARCPIPSPATGTGIEFNQDSSGTSAELRYYLAGEFPHSYSWGACIRTSDQTTLGNQEGPHLIGFFGASKLERISDEKNGARVIRWGGGELGNNITVQDATWYWVTGRRSVASGTIDLRIYSLPNFELVGSSTSSYVPSETTRLVYIWFGVEGTTPVGATYTEYIDSFLLDDTGSTWPLMPGSAPATSISIGGNVALGGAVRIQ